MAPLTERSEESRGQSAAPRDASRSPYSRSRTRGLATRRMPQGRRLNPFERVRLIAEILAAYIEARRVLRETSIEPAVHALRHRTLTDVGGEPPAAAMFSEAHRLGRAVQRTLSFTPGDTRCLTRSLVLTQLLAQRGIEAKLVIGARTQPSFLAHAWVEYSGQPVLPAGDGSFGRLVEL